MIFLTLRDLTWLVYRAHHLALVPQYLIHRLLECLLLLKSVLSCLSCDSISFNCLVALVLVVE